MLKFTHTINLAKLHVLTYFLPQPFNIFKKIYLYVILLYFDQTFFRKSFKLGRSRVPGVKIDIASIFDSLMFNKISQ